MKLTQHITSSYVTAANALKSHTSRRRIIAYVESYDDVLFWRIVLNQFETKDRYFEIMLPVQSNGNRKVMARGKKSAINSLLGNTGKDLIACVDADYDYLLQRNSPSSSMLLDTPYVFHTVAYSIENMQCYAEGLHDVVVMTTLNDHRIFDFESFLADYSRIVYPLFVWSVYLYRIGLYNLMSISDMDKIIGYGHFSIENASTLLERLGRKVKSKVAQLRSHCPDSGKAIADLKVELTTLGVTPPTCYLYLHGHHIFDNIVLPMVSSVCERLQRERVVEIRKMARHSTQMNNELSCYNSSLQDVTSMLKKNASYRQSKEYEMIIAQLGKVFG